MNFKLILVLNVLELILEPLTEIVCFTYENPASMPCAMHLGKKVILRLGASHASKN